MDHGVNAGAQLAVRESALREWKKLNLTLREQVKKVLAERLTSPHIPSSGLSGLKDRYKIKLVASVNV